MPQFAMMKWQHYTGFPARVVELALHQAGGTSTKKKVIPLWNFILNLRFSYEKNGEVYEFAFSG